MQGPSLLPLAVTQVTFQAPDPQYDLLTWIAQSLNRSDIPKESLLQQLCRPGSIVHCGPARASATHNLPGEFGCPTTPITSTAPLEVPIFYLNSSQRQGEGPYRASSQARAFLFQAPPYRALVDLGQPNGDQIVAHGARPTDRLCVYDPGNDRVGCKDIVPGDDQVELLKKEPGWEPQVIVSPVTSRTLQIELRLPLTDTNRGAGFDGASIPHGPPCTRSCHR